jgi:hypothetical protein
MWADSDSVTVLKDIEAVANDPSSTADVATLIADSQTADADADGHLLVNQATRAARQEGVKNIGGGPPARVTSPASRNLWRLPRTARRPSERASVVTRDPIPDQPA